MLDIRIEGYSVDLLPNTQITLEKYNPLLDFNTVQGARVNNFTLPNTPKNIRILGDFHNPQTPLPNRRWYCEKYVDSQLVERGFVKIADAPPNQINLYYVQNLGEIFGDLQTVLLSEMGFPAMPLSAPVAAADQLVDPYCFPMIENGGFYGNQAFGGIINPYDVNSHQYGQNPLVPHFFLRWVLQQFGQMAGWRFQGSFLQDPDYARLCLANLFSLDQASAINPSNHLPDLTMGGTLIQLRKLFNLFLDFDVRRKICDIGFCDDVLKQNTMIDWTTKADVNHLKLPDLVNRLQLGYELDSNDALLKPIPPSMVDYVTEETAVNEGGSVLPIKSRFSTYLTNPATGLAKTSQPGFSPSNKDSKTQATPKLLFWNGVVNGKPKATNASGSKSLLWTGANNLAEVGYQRFEAFKGNTFQLKKVIMLTPADVATFSFKNKVHVKGVNYVVGSLKLGLMKDQKVIPAQAELWKV